MTVGGLNLRVPSSFNELIRRVKAEKTQKLVIESEESSDRTYNTVSLTRDSPPSIRSNFCANVSGVSISNDFLPVQVAEAILKLIDSRQADFAQLRGRTCLPLGGKVTSSGLIPRDDVPNWLSKLMDDVHKYFLAPLNLPRPNHALINAYEPGEGIMAHEDGPAYTPYATILSLGSGCVFDFVSKSTNRTPVARIYLPVGSLLLFKDEAYEKVLHEFRHEKLDFLNQSVSNSDPLDPARLGDSRVRGSDGVLIRGRRVSITMRHVKVFFQNSD